MATKSNLNPSTSPSDSTPFGPQAAELAQFASKRKEEPRALERKQDVKRVAIQALHPNHLTSPTFSSRSVTLRELKSKPTSLIPQSSPLPITGGAASSIPSSMAELLSQFPVSASEEKSPETIHYLLCNEEKQIETLEQLAHSPTSPDSRKVHFGFSCWYNYDIMATRNSEGGIICDFDPNMIATLNLLRDSVLKSKNRAEFYECFWAQLRNIGSFHDRLLDADGGLDFDQFVERYHGRGWLSDELSYNWIRNMYLENRIIHRQLDITNYEAFASIHQWLAQNGIQFDTVYTSNIPEWLYKLSKTAELQMYQNLSAVIHPNTSVLTAKTEIKDRGSPVLSLSLGVHPKVEYARSLKTHRHSPFSAPRIELSSTSSSSSTGKMKRLDFEGF